MNRKLAQVVSLFMGVALLFCAAARSQDASASATKKLKFRKISVPAGVKELDVILDLVVMDKKNAIAFGTARAADDSWRLVSFRISNKGKASKANVIDFLTTEAAAIWNPASQSVPPAAPYGLVFYTYRPGDKLIVRVGKFDSSGKISADIRDLLEIPIPTGNFISSIDLAATLGSQSIAVTVNFKNYQGSWDDPGDAVAYFLQTDFSGKLIGSATKVSLSNGGKDLLFFLRKPMQAGANWLIPGISYNLKTGELSASAIQIKKSKAKVSTVYDVSPADGLDAEGGNAQFLPSATASGKGGIQLPPAGKSFELLIHHYKGLPYDPLRMRTEDFLLTIQKVKRTGKKAGSPYDLEADQWIPKLTADINKRLDQHREFVSYAAVDNDGKLVLAKSRYLQRSWNASPPVSMHDYENQLLLYLVDVKKKKAEVISATVPNADQTIGAPILVAKDGKFWTISHYKKSGDLAYVPYLSYF